MEKREMRMQRRLSLTRIVPIAAAGALVLGGLTACTSSNSDASSCTNALGAGALSDDTVVSSTAGAAPTVKLPENPGTIPVAQRSTVTTAKDRSTLVEAGDLVGVNVALFDVATGKSLYASQGFTGGSPAQEYVLSPEKGGDEPISAATKCAAPGDRLVVALTEEQSAPYLQQYGGEGNVVAVMDVVSTTPLSATGKTRSLPSGYPAVVTDTDGNPGVVVPPRKAPSSTRSAVRITGTGDEVTAKQSVIAQVLQVGWSDSTEKVNTRTGAGGQSAGPTLIPSEADATASGVDYRAELTGVPVGSQVVIIDVPQKGEASIYVIDVLAVQ